MTNIPRYQGNDRTPEHGSGPGVPPSVVTAVRFMYLGAVLSAITPVIGLSTSGDLRAAVHHAEPKLRPSQVSAAVHITEVSIVVVGLIGVGLWIWMAIANRRGREWARITGTVLFGLNTISLIANLVQHETTLAEAVALVVWAIGLGAVAFLWKPTSNAYFKAPKYSR